MHRVENSITVGKLIIMIACLGQYFEIKFVFHFKDKTYMVVTEFSKNLEKEGWVFSELQWYVANYIELMFSNGLMYVRIAQYFKWCMLCFLVHLKLRYVTSGTFFTQAFVC